MWKWILIALVVYGLYRMFMNDRMKKDEQGKKDKDHLVATGELVKDPVCGAYVDADATISVRNGDKVIRFCSYDCRDRYLEEQKKLED